MVERYISITRAEGTWSVRAGGAVLAESANALELAEGDYPPVIYFPREDIAMMFLDPSDRTSECPHKGTANYFSVAAKSGKISDVAWSYEAPKDAVARIKDHIAFYPDRVTVEQL
ncbi:DUF427 domain-containing protein [Pontivivens insulae]|uniref:DUF427 domain-containing protein n=1 Tax=Pontivivens insulae TaxID=1639689 RepID=A0A2R8ADN6_9RHOB|nr:DUF427 domain-containing protein [Pontivivens insulae]RED14254.1 uncharacterized protein (DUF427 family) [Pontivivens insulae]SPF30329.1 hypothetical protein POI8812_02665 [Pontivivens insulae]